MERQEINPTFFETPSQFRQWLEEHHDTAKELMVGYCKVGSGKASMTWSESVDQALCFGWIDGIRRSLDAERYCIRFTPRRSKSIWSSVNIKKVEELTKAGLMKPEGLQAFALRKEERSGIYGHETQPLPLLPEYEAQFRADKPAWDFFLKQPPSYRKAITHYIMGAKQEKTRLSRLSKIMDLSRGGLRMS